ncbi:MAG TPA: DUF4440 domain-containing protein [Usitatibacter sp.]|nr:DUF4440 domain-containing protein [Usitatibacter sp.]
MSENPDLRRHLFDLEEQLVKPAARSSRERLEELLAEDFFEFGSSGNVHDRAHVIAGALGESPGAWSIANFKMTLLAEDVALVTYIATQSAGASSLRSSVWRRSDGRWRMAFHQGTKIGE